MTRLTTIQCNGCGHIVPVGRYLVLEQFEHRERFDVIEAVAREIQIDTPADFCGLTCLREWINQKDGKA